MTSTALAETNKEEIIEWIEKRRTWEQVSRLATATTLEDGKTFEYIVDVHKRSIVKKTHQEGFQAGGPFLDN